MKIIRKSSPAPALPALRNDPFLSLFSGFGPWSSLFDDYRTHGPLSGITMPSTQVSEEGDAYLVKFDVPGVAKDAIEVTVEGNVISVSARRVTKTKDGESTLEYQRTLSLPERAKTESVTASLENGILTLSVPKDKAAKPRKIAIT